MSSSIPLSSHKSLFSKCNIIRNKHNYLELLLISNIHLIICIIESYLNNTDIDSSLLYNTYAYTLFHCDRNVHAIRILVICKSILNSLRIPNHPLSKTEFICLNITSNSNFRVLCIYIDHHH